MKRKSLLTAAALVLSMGAMAQVEDVTSQYITNPSFEDCNAMEVTTADDGSTYVDLTANYSTPSGTDYAAYGWTLQEQLNNSNAGVVAYGNTVKYSAYGNGYAMPEAGPTEASGTNALVFTGNPYSNGPVTYETAEVTLPAGWYRFTVQVYTYSGWAETASLTNTMAFIANDGTAYRSEKSTYKCNVWDGDTIIIELTAPATGRFQLGYTSSFYTAIDDVKLEYEAKIITSALEAVIAKAKGISAAIYDSDPELTAAIDAAEAFVQNPTSQDAVGTQVELLWTAIRTALENTYEPIDITEAFVENYSFETGKTAPWTGSPDLGVSTPSPWGEQPAIDGGWYAYFTWSASEWWLEQTVTGLPNGFYYLSALAMTGSSYSAATPVTLYAGEKEVTFTPETGIYTLGRTTVVEVTDGTLKIGAKADASFYIDNFRLTYCTDEEALNQGIYDAVVAQAKDVLNAEGNAIITGVERTAFEEAINATGDDLGALIDAINAAMTAFQASKASYQTFETAKTNAAAYSQEDYPYGSQEKYDAIQALCETVATSGDNALELAAQLDKACLLYYASNANVEGVADAVNYTSELGQWTLVMMEQASGMPWTDVDGVEHNNYYASDADFTSTSNVVCSMEQTLSNLPAGHYVFSCVMGAGYSCVPSLVVNGDKVAELPHTGAGMWTSSVYNYGWKDVVVEFVKYNGGDLTLRVEATAPYANNALYIDNIRLFKIADLTEDDTVYGIVGDFSAWDDDLLMNKDPETGLYTYTIENFAVKEVKAYEYKVRANKEWGGYELPMANNGNMSWTPEKTGNYNLTFTFNLAENTCTLDAEFVDDITWTCVYWNVEGWEHVYAYTWTGSVEQMGQWPGTELQASGATDEQGNDMYFFMYKGEKPEFIIFNNGQGGDANQTADLEFIDGHEYSDASKMTATGIDAVAASERSAAVYDLQGRRIDGQLKSGIYVRNGRKFMVK